MSNEGIEQFKKKGTLVKEGKNKIIKNGYTGSVIPIDPEIIHRDRERNINLSKKFKQLKEDPKDYRGIIKNWKRFIPEFYIIL